MERRPQRATSARRFPRCGEWKDSHVPLTDTERREFLGLFVQLLRDMFAGKIDDIADAQVHYLSEQRKENYAEVRTKLLSQKIDTLLDFRLVDKFGQWSVYDVVIDGASIVSNYQRNSPALYVIKPARVLVKKMKEKTLVVKAFETTTTP